MREFNHRRAWREWCKPNFDLLPACVHALLQQLSLFAHRIGQHDGLVIAHERYPEFVAGFSAIDPEVLREAAIVVYRYGHFAYEGTHEERLWKDGLYWKFQRIVDAWLSGHGQQPSKAWEDAHWRSEPFMNHKAGTPYDHDEVQVFLKSRVAPEFAVYCVDAVNYRVDVPIAQRGRYPRATDAHPFVIGSAHFGSLFIDVKKAPCNYCDCPHDWHKHDQVAMLALNRDLTNDEAQEALKRALDAAAAHNAEHPNDQIRLDGFAFVKGQYRFKSGSCTA